MGRLLLGKGGGALPPLLQLSLLRLLITWLNECPAAAAAFCAPTEVPLTLTLAPDPIALWRASRPPATSMCGISSSRCAARRSAPG